MHPSTTRATGPNSQHCFIYDLENPDRPPEYLFAVDAAERVARDPAKWGYELPQARKVDWYRS
jgi:hypothetical protein